MTILSLQWDDSWYLPPFLKASRKTNVYVHGMHRSVPGYFCLTLAGCMGSCRGCVVGRYLLHFVSSCPLELPGRQQPPGTGRSGQAGNDNNILRSSSREPSWDKASESLTAEYLDISTELNGTQYIPVDETGTAANCVLGAAQNFEKL